MAAKEERTKAATRTEGRNGDAPTGEPLLFPVHLDDFILELNDLITVVAVDLSVGDGRGRARTDQGRRN